MKLFLVAVVLAGLVAFAARSHGEVSHDGSEPLDPPPPTAKVSLNVGGAHQPFTPYDPGAGTWAYDKLTPEEKAQADHARSATNWSRISVGYALGIEQRADAAAASSADHQLGLEDSTEIGVVP